MADTSTWRGQSLWFHHSCRWRYWCISCCSHIQPLKYFPPDILCQDVCQHWQWSARYDFRLALMLRISREVILNIYMISSCMEPGISGYLDYGSWVHGTMWSYKRNSVLEDVASRVWLQARTSNTNLGRQQPCNMPIQRFQVPYNLL